MEFCYPKFTDIVIYSQSELLAEKAYVYLKDYFNIRYFLTDDDLKKNYLGLNCIQIEKYLQRYTKVDQTIIVLAIDGNERNRDVLKRLKDNGLSIYTNYIFLDMLTNNFSIDIPFAVGVCDTDAELETLVNGLANGRKKYIVNGNCQIKQIKAYLMANKEFRSKYFLLDIPCIPQYPQYKDIFSNDFVYSLCDLCLTQPVSDENKFCPLISTNKIFSRVKEDAVKVVFANCTFLGYFPQYCKPENVMAIANKSLAAYGDKYIDSMIEEGLSADIILKKVKSYNYLDKQFVSDFYREQLEITAERESSCDIKISDYIAARGKRKSLFYSFNHPINEVIKELVTRILKYLQIKDCCFVCSEAVDNDPFFKSQSQIIYPSVLYALGIHEDVDNKYYIANSLVDNRKLSFDEYVLYYVNANKKGIGISGKEKIKIDVWGGDVSTELIKWSDKFTIEKRIIQNPIHTLDGKPFNIETEDIKGAPYIASMAELNLDKTAERHFTENFNSDYLMIDICDCHNNIFMVSRGRDRNIKLVQTITVGNTLKALKEKDNSLEIKTVSRYDITDEQWQTYVNNFCDIILSKYKEDHIILNEFDYSQYYLENGKLVEFTTNPQSLRESKMIGKISAMLKERMPDCMVITGCPLSIADANHKLGLYTLHYVPEVYRVQNYKLEKLFGIENKNDADIEARYTQWVNSFEIAK